MELPYERLIDRADANVKDENENTLLHYACFRGFEALEKVKILLEKGANIDVKNKDGITPLFLMCCDDTVYDGYLHTFELLIEKGADVGVRDKQGNTMIHMMCSSKFSQVMEKEKIISMLIKNGIDINSKNNFGDTVLTLYMHRNKCPDLKSINYLIDNGADINIDEDTPLHLACKIGDYELVKLLVSKGADIDAKNPSGETPLDYAYDKNISRIIFYLRDHKTAIVCKKCGHKNE